MAKELLETIKQVGIFIICAQALMHFRPSETYEKYFKLLVSIMVLIQLLAPIFSLMQGKNTLSLQDAIVAYEESLNANMARVNQTSMIADSMVNDLTELEIKSRLNNDDSVDVLGEGEGKEAKSLEDEIKQVGIQVEKIEVKSSE